MQKLIWKRHQILDVLLAQGMLSAQTRQACLSQTCALSICQLLKNTFPLASNRVTTGENFIEKLKMQKYWAQSFAR